MFIGEFQHNIDAKGRVIIPAKFREELGEHFIVTKGLDKCLFVYPLEGWKNVESNLRQLSFTHADSRAFSRLFFSGAVEVELDRQGRILLPATLRSYASLDKDVFVIGVSGRVEIWDEAVWLAYSQKADNDYEAIAEKINGLDFGL